MLKALLVFGQVKIPMYHSSYNDSFLTFEQMMMKMQDNLEAMEERMPERMESMEGTFSRLDSRLETLEGQLSNPGNLVRANDIFFVCLNSLTKMAWFSLHLLSHFTRFVFALVFSQRYCWEQRKLIATCFSKAQCTS